MSVGHSFIFRPMGENFISSLLELHLQDINELSHLTINEVLHNEVLCNEVALRANGVEKVSKL